MTLQQHVQQIVDGMLEDYDNANSLLTDLSYGCSSGIVSELVYYSDTIAFYDKHEDELEDLREELGANADGICNGSFSITQYKNNMAWYGFETIAYQYLEQLIDEGGRQ